MNAAYGQIRRPFLDAGQCGRPPWLRKSAQNCKYKVPAMPSQREVTWVLVADGVHGKIFLHEGKGSGFKELPDGAFAGTNRHTRDLVSDRAGRSFDSHGQARHMMEPRTDPHEDAKVRFARILANHLDQAASRDAFDRLVLVLPAKALGTLRAELAHRVTQRVVAALGKDLTNVPAHELDHHLREVAELRL